jgi:hypothetical protein
MSQSEAILAHLQAGESLTAMQALSLFNCLRLGARVLDLRRAGYDIRSEIIRTPSGKNVARYTLPGPSEC